MLENIFSKESYNHEGTTLLYRFHLPECGDDGKAHPLILFLHGAGERGDNNDAQLINGVVPALSDPESPWHNSYIIAPQCPLEKQWVDTPWAEGAYSIAQVAETPYLAAAYSLILDTIEKYPVDKKKVLVMGISMGGFGSWDTISRHGDTFTGAFICCGGGDPSMGEALRDKVIYTYHGSTDPVVPVSGTRETVGAIVGAGGDKITYREYPGMDHWTWDRAYSEHEDMKALFERLG